MMFTTTYNEVIGPALDASLIMSVRLHLPHLMFLLAAALVHALGVLMLAGGIEHAQPNSVPRDSMLMIYTQPKIRETDSELSQVDISKLLLKVDVSQAALRLSQPDIDFYTSYNAGARFAVPTLDESAQPPIGPYVHQASLLPGEGAMVVLRIEVLEDGTTGRVQVDTSSGSRQVDEAATAYARTLRWRAGRMAGSPRVMWIRWSVHLQA